MLTNIMLVQRKRGSASLCGSALEVQCLAARFQMGEYKVDAWFIRASAD